MAAASPPRGTPPPVKAGVLRSGAGSRNFSTVRSERAKEGVERDLAHKVDCGLSAIVTTACGTPLDELQSIRESLSHGDNLRMKTARGNRETDRVGERTIASVARGEVGIEKLRTPAVRSKAKQMLRSYRAGVFNDSPGDSDAVKANKARHRDVIKAVVQYSLKHSPDRDQYVLPTNNDKNAAKVMRQLAADYKGASGTRSRKVESVLTLSDTKGPGQMTAKASAAKDPASSASRSSGARPTARTPGTSTARSAKSPNPWESIGSSGARSTTRTPGTSTARSAKSPNPWESSGHNSAVARRLDYGQSKETSASRTAMPKSALASSRNHGSSSGQARVEKTPDRGFATDGLYMGPQGGVYQMTSGGNKQYVPKFSIPDDAVVMSDDGAYGSTVYGVIGSLAGDIYVESSGTSAGSPGAQLFQGPRGGIYSFTSGGNKCYISSPSSAQRGSTSYAPTASYGGASYGYSGASGGGSGGAGGGRALHTGPRGGTYYINGNGNKTYVRS